MASAIRTFVTFESDKFNSSEAKDYFINPCCYGDDVCKWLIGELKAASVECDVEPGQEDFGWYFNFAVGEAKYCFVCGFRPAEGEDPAVWVAWVERSVGFFASIFGARDKNVGADGPRAIHQALASCPDITNIRWHFKKDFDSGKEEVGAEAPES
jgi:hypothetical protein